MRNLLLLFLVGVLAFSCQSDPAPPSIEELKTAFNNDSSIVLLRKLPVKRKVQFLGNIYAGEVQLPVDTMYMTDEVLYIAGKWIDGVDDDAWLSWAIIAGLPEGSVGASFQEELGVYETQFWDWENAKLGDNQPFRIQLDDGSVITGQVHPQ